MKRQGLNGQAQKRETEREREKDRERVTKRGVRSVVEYAVHDYVQLFVPARSICAGFAFSCKFMAT